MAKKQVSNKEEQEVVVEPTANLTHTALGVYKDPKTNKWYLTKIQYNPETKQLGELELVDKDENSKDATIFRFKIIAAQEVFKD